MIFFQLYLRLTDNAARESALIVAELRAGKINSRGS
jgi:hypothetical protein